MRTSRGRAISNLKRFSAAWVLVLSCTTSTIYATTIPSEWTDVASQANITFISTTSARDKTFSKLEARYRPAGNSLSVPGKWAGFCRQGGRNITFNLGTWKYVTSVQLSFEQNTHGGIYWPSYMRILTSQDGQHWSAFGGASSGSDSGNIDTLTVSSATPVKAAYMKIIFPVKLWVFAGQLHIWNNPNVSTLVTPPFVPTKNAPPPRGMLQSGDIGGIHHMLLVYTGGNGALGSWSSQDFIPMIDYINPQGIAESQMFGTMLFLPYNNAGTTASGWSSYLANLFGPNGELANLNAAAQQAGRLIYDNNLTEKVVIAMPYPSPSVSNFGAVNASGTNLDFNPSDPGMTSATALANQESAMSWYFNQVITLWKQNNYSNLQLSGIYWNDESYMPATDDPALVTYLHSLTQQAGLPLIWIPYFGAAGIGQWQQEGFDGVILQSNYYQTASATTSRIQHAIQAENQYGLGLEVELGEAVLTNQTMRNRYATELQTMAQDLPSTPALVTAFYDGSKVLLTASQSSDPSVRKIYDETGQWIQQH